MRTATVALFFVSGLSSLVLETVWVRMMVLVFGSTSFAVSTVLTAFMGGLALGSWIAGRRAARLARPRWAVMVYGLLEGGIGLYALLLPWLAGRLPSVHAALWGVGQSSYLTFALGRFLLAALLLLIPTAAMGATLPVLTHFACAGEPPGRTAVWAGRLYAVNTFGAVAGVALAGFVLLPKLGLRATNTVACLGDLGLFASALLLALRGRKQDLVEGEPANPPPAFAPSQMRAPLAARLAVASIGVSGAVAMVYQVAWTRGLSLVIGSSTYAFSLILLCFLVGLAAGAAAYSSRQARHPDQAGNLGVVHLLTAAGAIGGALMMDRLPLVMLLLLRHVELRPSSVFLVQLLLAGLVLLVPTFFMGMVFPAVVALSQGANPSTTSGASRITGDVYAVNTLGAIFGSFAGGFLLLPALGLQKTLLSMILCSLALAVLFGTLATRRPSRAGVLAGAALLAAVGFFGSHPWSLELMTSGVFRVSRYRELMRKKVDRARSAAGTSPTAQELAKWDEAAQRLLSPRALDTGLEHTVGYRITRHRDGVTTAVSIARTVESSLSARACWVRHALLVNGKVDASLAVLRGLPAGRSCRDFIDSQQSGEGLGISAGGDAETQILSGLLPSLLLPAGRRPDQVAVIGWGSGMSVGAALQASPRRVVAIELEAEVIEAARVFRPHNHQPETDSRVMLVSEDGRNYLHSTRERFDVIISEPSNPWISGCGNLFTREFFARVRDRLNRGGLFLQWLQAYEISPENVFSILGTLADEFPAVHVFSPARASNDLLLVAQTEPRPFDWPALEERWRQPALARELARVDIRDAADLLARRVAGPDHVRLLGSSAPRNTDDNARLEFAAPRDLVNYSRFSHRKIAFELRRGLPDPMVGVERVPADGRARLCRALLRAGRRDVVASIIGGRPAPAECAELARRLQAPAARPDRSEVLARLGADPRRSMILEATDRPPLVAAAKLARLLRPETDNHLGFWLIGRLLAAAGDEHRAILLLMAASVLGEQQDEVRQTLAHLLFSREQAGAAVELLSPASLDSDERSR